MWLSRLETRNEGGVISVSRKKSDAEKIAELQDENAFLALGHAITQSRLDQSEQEQAQLMLELVQKGVM